MQRRNIFSAPISVFTATAFDNGNGIGTKFGKHYVRPMGAFLRAGIHYAGTITMLRQTLNAAYTAWDAGDTELYHRLIHDYTLHKWDSPFAILQGVNPSHSNNGFVSFTDVCCLDIDQEKPHKGTNGNEWVQDWAELRDVLRDNPYIAYAGLSAGGHGVFLIVPIANHEQHSGHWRALCRLFKDYYNLTIDPATENIGRLRFMSHDPDAYFNEDAAVFELIEEQRAPRQVRQYAAFHADGDTERRIADAVRIIEQQHIDITVSHDEWKKASAAIAHYFGERGRDLFHRIAAQYPGYRERENDRLYTNMMKSYAGQQADIGSLFYLFRLHGIDTGTRGFSVPVVASPSRPRSRPTPATMESSTPTEPTRPDPSAHLATLSKAEQFDIETHRQHIEEGRAMVRKARQKSPAFDYLCDRLQLSYYGHGDWNMTDAEFDALMNEHPEPPF